MIFLYLDYRYQSDKLLAVLLLIRNNIRQGILLPRLQLKVSLMLMLDYNSIQLYNLL